VSYFSSVRAACVGLLLTALTTSLSARYFQPAPNWSYRNVGGQTYYLYTPDNVEAGRKYPIVLTKHGCCWDGDTTHTIGDPMTGSWINEILNVQSEPFYILAPHNQSSYQASIVTYLRSLFNTLPIDTQRVIIAGFSMGASGVANFVSANPTLFSAGLAVAIANGTISTAAKDMPLWLAVGASDGYMSNVQTSVTNLRTANGDSRGPLARVYGVNPRYDIYPFTGHGDAMEGLFGTPGAVEWALSHRNDGNHRPVIRFTHTSPAWGEILAAATTSITVSAAASDNDGSVAKVEFFLNGELEATVTAAPYQTTISGLVPGDYILTATATDNGASQGKAFDKTATDSIRFGIRGTPTVPSATLPAASAGVFYRDTMVVSGGNWPFNWTGTGLPPGLTLTKSGRLEGIPTVPGSYTFTVSVVDTNGTLASGSMSLDVGAVPPNVVLITDLVKRGMGPFVPWVFRLHEAYKTTGLYGLPKGEGLVRGDPHPLYDAVLDPGVYDGCTFIRPSGLSQDIDNTTPADWLSFTVNVDTKVHVCYPRANSSFNIPSWLNGNGWTRTDQVVKAIRQDYYDYVKEFPAGTVTLGPNNGSVVTNVGNHYLAIVEPSSVSTGQSRSVPRLERPQVRMVQGRGLVVSGLAGNARQVRVLDTRGRTVARVRAEGIESLTVPAVSVAPDAYVLEIAGASTAESRVFTLR